MLKLVTTTAALSMGVGLTFGTMIAALALVFR